eukprot:SAG31_NODE_1511_length_8060_cov_3.005653_1_plen_74_part_00
MVDVPRNEVVNVHLGTCAVWNDSEVATKAERSAFSVVVRTGPVAHRGVQPEFHSGIMGVLRERLNARGEIFRV